MPDSLYSFLNIVVGLFYQRISEHFCFCFMCSIDMRKKLKSKENWPYSCLRIYSAVHCNELCKETEWKAELGHAPMCKSFSIILVSSQMRICYFANQCRKLQLCAFKTLCDVRDYTKKCVPKEIEIYSQSSSVCAAFCVALCTKQVCGLICEPYVLVIKHVKSGSLLCHHRAHWFKHCLLVPGILEVAAGGDPTTLKGGLLTHRRGRAVCSWPCRLRAI